ncbi:hypothetical protein FIBSPDRAFT_850696 [Athelia psychrophila]|uniref:Uncharacterized protein n=1 Tax=Athelia psychrophila TaxID=1759441 RepID=A0A166TAS8_9AGAM|nr:hypothetical protein FIBSPDRAFT_850696 [Fibularhizoctonia sp. CBS 109695]
MPREPVRGGQPCPPRNQRPLEGKKPKEADGAEDAVVDGYHVAFALGSACVDCCGVRAVRSNRGSSRG